MAAAMLALPISAVYATKPTVITGTVTMINPILYVSIRDLGNSGNQIWTFTDAPLPMAGDMERTGSYTGTWLVQKPFTPDMKVPAANGVYHLDVKVMGASGELTIGVHFVSSGGYSNLVIIGGTGDLKNLHGTGVLTPETMLLYYYSMDVHFDP
jgi:hypothetical protein